MLPTLNNNTANDLTTLGFASNQFPSQEEIKKKYKQLAQQTHTDVNSSNTNDSFHTIQQAYENLTQSQRYLLTPCHYQTWVTECNETVEKLSNCYKEIEQIKCLPTKNNNSTPVIIDLYNWLCNYCYNLDSWVHTPHANPKNNDYWSFVTEQMARLSHRFQKLSGVIQCQRRLLELESTLSNEQPSHSATNKAIASECERINTLQQQLYEHCATLSSDWAKQAYPANQFIQEIQAKINHSRAQVEQCQQVETLLLHCDDYIALIDNIASNLAELNGQSDQPDYSDKLKTLQEKRQQIQDYQQQDVATLFNSSDKIQQIHQEIESNQPQRLLSNIQLEQAITRLHQLNSYQISDLSWRKQEQLNKKLSTLWQRYTKLSSSLDNDYNDDLRTRITQLVDDVKPLKKDYDRALWQAKTSGITQNIKDYIDDFESKKIDIPKPRFVQNILNEQLQALNEQVDNTELNNDSWQILNSIERFHSRTVSLIAVINHCEASETNSQWFQQAEQALYQDWQNWRAQWQSFEPPANDDLATWQQQAYQAKQAKCKQAVSKLANIATEAQKLDRDKAQKIRLNQSLKELSNPDNEQQDGNHEQLLTAVNSNLALIKWIANEIQEHFFAQNDGHDKSKAQQSEIGELRNKTQSLAKALTIPSQDLQLQQLNESLPQKSTNLTEIEARLTSYHQALEKINQNKLRLSLLHQLVNDIEQRSRTEPPNEQFLPAIFNDDYKQQFRDLFNCIVNGLPDDQTEQQCLEQAINTFNKQWQQAVALQRKKHEAHQKFVTTLQQEPIIKDDLNDALSSYLAAAQINKLDAKLPLVQLVDNKQIQPTLLTNASQDELIDFLTQLSQLKNETLQWLPTADNNASFQSLSAMINCLSNMEQKLQEQGHQCFHKQIERELLTPIANKQQQFDNQGKQIQASVLSQLQSQMRDSQKRCLLQASCNNENLQTYRQQLCQALTDCINHTINDPQINADQSIVGCISTHWSDRVVKTNFWGEVRSFLRMLAGTVVAIAGLGLPLASSRYRHCFFSPAVHWDLQHYAQQCNNLGRTNELV